ncbi:hypothetical protein M405DRAFT_860913, partial [Rhizopogon salebrosus TDB-379]
MIADDDELVELGELADVDIGSRIDNGEVMVITESSRRIDLVMYEPLRRYPAFREPDALGFIPIVRVMLLGNEFCVRVARDDSKRMPDVGDVQRPADD